MASNTITIVGNLTRDPELRYTPSGQSNTRFGVAVNRRWQDRSSGEWQEATSFFDVVCWRELAENVSESLGKGSRVLVTGRLEQRTWETKEGDKRNVVEIIADEVGASLRFATAKVERNEGMTQTELAEQMEMQPITLTRLIDKLCGNDWIERRGDASDRRVNRLYLLKAGRALLGRLSGLRSELTATALDGIHPADAHQLLAQLEQIKENVRNAIQATAGESRKEQRYG